MAVVGATARAPATSSWRPPAATTSTPGWTSERKLAQLRANSVLDDRDEHGEYLHVCTEMPGSRIFFELVQRIGGHARYGVPNAPVRMAAHRRQRLAVTGG
ncbi:hypothetical protein [Saccharopolyspora indica]|uniref:hypothetical protein n=1 Tax=Saccharopolyspora indica TaxID=1229659 RepID=UPI002FDBC91B